MRERRQASLFWWGWRFAALETEATMTWRFAPLPFLFTLVMMLPFGGCESSGMSGEVSAVQCRDGVDNDEDGYTDCADQDCFEFVFCVGDGSPDAARVADDAHVASVDAGPSSPDADVSSGDIAQLDVPAGSPAVTIFPETVDFGAISIGDVVVRTVTVGNIGSGTLALRRVTVDAAPPFSVRLGDRQDGVGGGFDLTPPVLLEPGAEVSLTVEFAPASRAIVGGALTVWTDDPSAPNVSVALRGWGVDGGTAELEADPAAIEFGPRLVGQEATLQLVLWSRGDVNLVVDRLEFSGDSSNPSFSLDLGSLGRGETPVSPTAPIVVPPNDFVAIDVDYMPTVVGESDDRRGRTTLDVASLLVGSNALEPLVVGVSGYGVERDCPQAVIGSEQGEEVIPQTTLRLDGEQSYGMGGEIRKWEWRVEQPTGSQSRFVPSASFPNPSFTANVAGVYRFYLDVWDGENIVSCEPAVHEISVVPDEDIHVELMWSTPGDRDETDTGPFVGADMDLHFFHPNAPSDPNAPDLDGDGMPDPYFDKPYDTYWFNPHPNWGEFDDEVDDDPGLDRDDTDGAGPENVNLANGEDGATYGIAAHYWNDHGYGESFATVRVYIRRVLVYEVAGVRLVNRDLWNVATVDWPSGDVEPVDGPDGGHAITPNYSHPMFFD